MIPGTSANPGPRPLWAGGGVKLPCLALLRAVQILMSQNEMRAAASHKGGASPHPCPARNALYSHPFCTTGKRRVRRIGVHGARGWAAFRSGYEVSARVSGADGARTIGGHGSDETGSTRRRVKPRRKRRESLAP